MRGARDRAARSSTHQQQRRRGRHGGLTRRTNPARGRVHTVAGCTRVDAGSSPAPSAPPSRPCSRSSSPSAAVPPRDDSPSRSAASGTAAPTAGLIAAATDRFLAMEHAADRTSVRHDRGVPAPPRPSAVASDNTPLRVSARPPSGSHSSSTTTSSTSGTSEAVDTAEQASPPSSSSSSSSTSSGSGQAIPSDPAAHLAQLELGLELLEPIQSDPPLTRHRSRHLQLPVARTRPTSTGR